LEFVLKTILNFETFYFFLFISQNQSPYRISFCSLIYYKNSINSFVQ